MTKKERDNLIHCENDEKVSEKLKTREREKIGNLEGKVECCASNVSENYIHNLCSALITIISVNF